MCYFLKNSFEQHFRYEYQQTLNSKTSLEKFRGVVEVPFYFGQPKFAKLPLRQKVANTIVALF